MKVGGFWPDKTQINQEGIESCRFGRSREKRFCQHVINTLGTTGCSSGNGSRAIEGHRFPLVVASHVRKVNANVSRMT